jgi:hypothetical protein
MTWKNDTRFGNIDELFKNLLNLGRNDDTVACRGQADINRPLKASLDRILDINADYTSRLAEETAIIEKFRILSFEYFPNDFEKNLLSSQDKIKALSILQQYCTPTRLLDWTFSPWVALYFASIEHHDKDGSLWWFQQKPFYDVVGPRWDKYSMKRYPPDRHVNLNDTAFKNDGPSWISMVFHFPKFHRLEVQQGFFTVAGRLGLNHGDLIADVMNENPDQFARIVIPASWKQEILDRLRIMNIHSKSLDYPGADLVGIELTKALKQSCQL